MEFDSLWYEPIAGSDWIRSVESIEESFGGKILCADSTLSKIMFNALLEFVEQHTPLDLTDTGDLVVYKIDDFMVLVESRNLPLIVVWVKEECALRLSELAGLEFIGS